MSVKALFPLIFLLFLSCTNPYEKGETEIVENKILFDIPTSENIRSLVTSPYDDKILINVFKSLSKFIRYSDQVDLEIIFEPENGLSQLSPYRDYLLNTQGDSIKIFQISTGNKHSIYVDGLYSIKWQGTGDSLLLKIQVNDTYDFYTMSVPDFSMNHIFSIEESEYPKNEVYAYPYLCYKDNYQTDGNAIDFIKIVNTETRQKDSLLLQDTNIREFNISNDGQRIAFTIQSDLNYFLKIYDMATLQEEDIIQVDSYYHYFPQWNKDNNKILLSSQTSYMEIDLNSGQIDKVLLDLQSLYINMIWAPGDSLQSLQGFGSIFKLYEYSYSGQREKIFESVDQIPNYIYTIDNNILVMLDSLYWIEDQHVVKTRAWDDDLKMSYYYYSNGKLLRLQNNILLVHTLDDNLSVEYDLDGILPWQSGYSYQIIDDKHISIYTADGAFAVLDLENYKIHVFSEFYDVKAYLWADPSSPVIPYFGNYAYGRYRNDFVLIFEQSRQIRQINISRVNNFGWSHDGQSLIYERNNSVLKNQVLYLSD